MITSGGGQQHADDKTADDDVGALAPGRPAAGNPAQISRTAAMGISKARPKAKNSFRTKSR